MTFKEFSAWCNQRACDGMWGINTAIVCMEAGTAIAKKPFWKREKEWQKWNADQHIEEIFVNWTNEKIAEIMAKESEAAQKAQEGAE
ncbi:MAG: hypothetical protein M0R40_11180 [Firmicutes bacterium]|nr:hypothetical protein [Bacillota bacterium]